MDPQQYLSEWTKIYIKYKDSMQKKITEIDQKGKRIDVKYKEKTTSYFPLPALDEFAKAENGSIIITLNTSNNFKIITEKWPEFVKRKLTVIFINPMSKLENKWAVATHIHDAICDKSSLKQGLKSMSDTVEPINPEQIKSLATTAP